jgi:hypothetical protein
MRPKSFVASITLALATLVAGVRRAGVALHAESHAGGSRVRVRGRDSGERGGGPGRSIKWSTTAHPLRRSGAPGAWTIVVPLPPGDHLFMFLVDGTRWVSPPIAEEYVDDGFGARNGVVVVRPTAP